MTVLQAQNETSSIKARQKAMWESGDFGQVAKYNVATAEEFMWRLPLVPGLRVLDVACGSGNLALIAARRGCVVSGVDIADNLLAQARGRATNEGLQIDFRQGDAEELPFPQAHFDCVVSMYGAMFAPRPDAVAAELARVTKPGGLVGMANWTAEGFIGKMFDVFKAHLPPPPPRVPSTLLWGHEATVRARLSCFTEVKLTRQIAVLRYPFPPHETVEFFRRYYGPTGKAFASLDPAAQEALRQDLIALHMAHNTSSDPHTTEARAEYLEVIAVR